jgi:hypothetical protein
MADTDPPITGGCLCGAVRYEAAGAPAYMGFCYCADCRKASGSGFIPFMGFAAGAVKVSGPTLQFRSQGLRGEAVRNSCPLCGGLVFGGGAHAEDSHNIYAGSLDDPSRFVPTVAIFAASRPDWAPMPPGLKVFDGLPG